jgi:hypothetical protein
VLSRPSALLIFLVISCFLLFLGWFVVNLILFFEKLGNISFPNLSNFGGLFP